jgi:phage terminase large subunit GpA-like protein
MDAVTDPNVREIWVQKSAQIGWTEIINNIIGYFIHQDPSPIMIVQPTQDAAEDWSRDRLAPMIRDTPVLRERISDHRSRDSTNTLRHKTFPGGLLSLAISNSPSSLASKPIRVILFDEVDKYPPSARHAGDPVALGMKRTTNFWNRKILGGSTPTIKEVSKIVARFEGSDQRYYFVPCPHCHEPQRLVWAQVKWDSGKPETSAYCCEHCGTLWNDGERIAALAHGEWRASKPFNGIAGFHLSEIYSPFVKLSEMVANFLQAKSLPETLQQWVNESLGEAYEQAGSTVEPGSLLERIEQYGPENVPGGVLLLTAGVDVQDDRIEVQLNGWGADEENWVIDQRVFRGDPGKPALWLEVDEYLLQQFPTEDGRHLFVEAVAVDSGGHNTQAVYQFVVSRKRRRVWAIKGMAGAGRLAWPKQASRTAKSRAKVYLIGVDTIKGVLYGRLTKVPEPGPGYIHLPHSWDEKMCAQLTSEKAVTKYVRGRATLVWEPRSKGIAQEAQDCWNYAYAAMIGRGGAQLLSRMAKQPRAARAVKAVESVDSADSDASEQPSAVPVTPKPKQKFARKSSAFKRGWFSR